MTQNSNNPPYKQCTMPYKCGNYQINKNDLNNHKKTSQSLLKPFSKKENSKKPKKNQNLKNGFNTDIDASLFIWQLPEDVYVIVHFLWWIVAVLCDVILYFEEIYKNGNWNIDVKNQYKIMIDDVLYIHLMSSSHLYTIFKN